MTAPRRGTVSDVQTIVGLSRGLILISCVCYLAAVIIALNAFLLIQVMSGGG